jgi:hypothetical protein
MLLSPYSLCSRLQTVLQGRRVANSELPVEFDLPDSSRRVAINSENSSVR